MPHRASPTPLLLLLLCAALPGSLQAQLNPPHDATALVSDDFDHGQGLVDWSLGPEARVEVHDEAGLLESPGLVIVVDSGVSRLEPLGGTSLPAVDEAYLSFWINADGARWSGRPGAHGSDETIEVARVDGPSGRPLISLRIRRSTNGRLEGFLQWRSKEMSVNDRSGGFVIHPGWQHVTLGFRVDSWLAAWVNGRRLQAVERVDHLEPLAESFAIGKTATSLHLDVSGELRFDKILFEVPPLPELWVDARHGDDAFDGRTRESAFRTVTRASLSARSGTTVRILPGIYRESIEPPRSGREKAPVVFVAEEGPGTVAIRGSVPSSALRWRRVEHRSAGIRSDVDPTEIWVANLASLGLTEGPRFIVQLDEKRRPLTSLHRAREPDYRVSDPMRRTADWWMADGGTAPTHCNPRSQPECDAWNRSDIVLTDSATRPQRLRTLDDLVGATAVMLDRGLNHYFYKRRIVEHDPVAGQIVLDEKSTAYANEPGLGWGTRFYVEDHIALLDQPGEWYFDRDSQRLFLWPPEPGDPAEQGLEVSVLDTAIKLTGRSHVHLRNLDLELFNGTLYVVKNWTHHRSAGLAIIGSRLRWADTGIELSQQIGEDSPADRSIEGFRLVDSELAHLHTHAITATQRWPDGSSAEAFSRSGFFNTLIKRNEIHDVGFSAELAGASSGSLVFRHPDRLRFTENHVHDIAGDGILLLESVSESDRYWDLALSEIGLGEIEVSGNIIERTCLIKGDCGGVRLWGVPLRKHVFRDLWIVGNTIRDVLGWSPAAELRGGAFEHGRNPGAVGYGIYVDNCSGLLAYRNVIHGNGRSGIYLVKRWRDGDTVIANNTIVDNRDGIRFGSVAVDQSSVSGDIINNIITDNEVYGIVLRDRDGRFGGLRIDGNLYYRNGWGAPTAASPGDFVVDVLNTPNKYLRGVWQIRAATPFEDHGQEGAPRFLSYRRSDRLDGFEGLFDFRLAPLSGAIDRGLELPREALDSLERGGLRLLPPDGRWDIGAFEASVPVSE